MKRDLVNKPYLIVTVIAILLILAAITLNFDRIYMTGKATKTSSSAIESITYAEDTVGFYRPKGYFYLKDYNSESAFASSGNVGGSTKEESYIIGDWDGDGYDNVGVWKKATSTFILAKRLPITSAEDVITFTIGTQYHLPIVGNWDNDAIEEAGLYRFISGTGGRFTLLNDNVGSVLSTRTFAGARAEDKPIVGDWNGDGVDDLGLFRKITSPNVQKFILLTNDPLDSTKLVSLIEIPLGLGSDDGKPLIGDWDGDNIDEVGLYKNSQATFYLDYDNNPSTPLKTVTFGRANNNDKPIVGDWNGDGKVTIGLHRDWGGSWYLSNSNEAPALDTIMIFGPNTGIIGISGKWKNCDVDNDGYYSGSCGGNDCDDNNPSLYPGVDYDDDTFTCENDCDDFSENVNPQVNEMCGDMIDNNCDGAIDNSCGSETCPDGFVRCAYNGAENFYQPQRCVINNGQGVYEDEGDPCTQTQCKVVNVLVDQQAHYISRIVCTNGVSIVGERTAISMWGKITFPDRVTSSDFAGVCVEILDRYYNIDTQTCPNLALQPGEKLVVEFDTSKSSDYHERVSLFIDSGGFIKCPLEICNNIVFGYGEFNYRHLSYEVHNPFTSSPMAKLTQGSGGSGGSGDELIVEYDCCGITDPPDECNAKLADWMEQAKSKVGCQGGQVCGNPYIQYQLPGLVLNDCVRQKCNPCPRGTVCDSEGKLCECTSASPCPDIQGSDQCTMDYDAHLVGSCYFNCMCKDWRNPYCTGMPGNRLCNDYRCDEEGNSEIKLCKGKPLCCPVGEHDMKTCECKAYRNCKPMAFPPRTCKIGQDGQIKCFCTGTYGPDPCELCGGDGWSGNCCYCKGSVGMCGVWK